MFNSDSKNNSAKDAETIIGPSIKVKGNFHGQGNIIIEGEVEGSVKTDNHLLIGSKANISANISAKSAKIGGRVTGDLIISGFLELDSTAIINGNVQCEQISVEKGAKLNGNCSMDKNIVQKDNSNSTENQN